MPRYKTVGRFKLNAALRELTTEKDAEIAAMRAEVERLTQNEELTRQEEEVATIEANRLRARCETLTAALRPLLQLLPAWTRERTWIIADPRPSHKGNAITPVASVPSGWVVDLDAALGESTERTSHDPETPPA